jgi:hypothetical protein
MAQFLWMDYVAPWARLVFIGTMQERLQFLIVRHIENQHVSRKTVVPLLTL